MTETETLELNMNAWSRLMEEGFRKSPVFDQIKELAQEGNAAAMSRALESLADEVKTK